MGHFAITIIIVIVMAIAVYHKERKKQPPKYQAIAENGPVTSNTHFSDNEEEELFLNSC